MVRGPTKQEARRARHKAGDLRDPRRFDERRSPPRSIESGQFPLRSGASSLPSGVEAYNDNLAENAADTPQIRDSAVVRSKLAAGAAGTAEIGEAAVIRSRIAKDAVGPVEIAPLAVDTAHMKDGAVVRRNIGTNAVSDAEIAGNSVGAAHIKPGGVKRANIDLGDLYTALDNRYRKL